MRYDIVRFKLLSHMLLMQHSGLTLSDTALCEDEMIKNFIEEGVSPVEAINKIGIPIKISEVSVSY
ncbi:TA system toxin CbtA family protein [Xenorhabdus khoisanae]|uniref:TA system toxin CbtA family protein n=1 Tax=Xenorhabdus khoisanae TaxID=880157 RepID=UPI002358AF56|nr:TA system toxin CbtA family protein [Xenorhabdus khoisanae]MDC9612886.1 TA system toxin CbtA family protein [Xenorhabdus khoisanae]